MTGERVCAFCGSSGTLTREHVFGDWLSKIGLENELVQRVAGPLNQIGKRMGNTRTFDTKVKNVCAPCNNGWMSRLETVAQRVLTPLILGQPARIETVDQGAIAAWIQKTALMAMYVSSAEERKGGYGVASSEYDRFYDQRERMEPLPNSLFWVAHYTGSLGLGSVWVTPLALNAKGLPEAELPHAYSITIALGQLLIHGIRFTSVPFYVDIATERPLSQIWPKTEYFLASQTLPDVSDEEFLGLAHGRRFVVANPVFVLRPLTSLMESPANELSGSVVKMPAPCGKNHFICYPATLAMDGMRGRAHWFMTMCECDLAYLVHTERDGAHVKSAGEPDRIEAEYEALAGHEVILGDAGGSFACKMDESTRS